MKYQIYSNLVSQKFFIYQCTQETVGRAKSFFSAEYLSVVEINNKSSKKSLTILRLPLLIMSRVLALRASVKKEGTQMGEVGFEVNSEKLTKYKMNHVRA